MSAPAAAAAAAAPVASAPRIVELGAGSVALPKGARNAAPSPPAAAAQGAAPATPPDGAQAGTAASSVQSAPMAAAQPEGPAQARKGAGLLGRLLGIMPLAAGLTQIILGLMITRGTVSLAAVPLLGSVPKFIVGGLVASTAMPSLMGGLMKLLGKSPPAMMGGAAR